MNRNVKIIIAILFTLAAFGAIYASLMRGDYGFSIFIFLPISIGIVWGTAIISNKPMTFKQLLTSPLFIAFSIITFSSILLLAGGVEGMICILMAAGLIFLPLYLGVFVGIFINRIVPHDKNQLKAVGILFLLNPFVMVHDYYDKSCIESTVLQSEVVNFQTEELWNKLHNPLQFKNDNPLFRAGIATPKSLCFVDDSIKKFICTTSLDTAILNVQENKAVYTMKFTLAKETKIMQELTPYDSIDAPHLHGYFDLKFIEIKLKPLDQFNTEVVVNTAYRYKLAPHFYWKWWTDYLIRTMHSNIIQSVMNSK